MFAAYFIATVVFLIVGFVSMMNYSEHHEVSNKQVLQGLGVVFGWPILFPIWIGVGFIFMLIATYKFLTSNL